MSNLINATTKIKNDIIHKDNIKKNQIRYNDLLTNCKYNRKTADFRAGISVTAGDRLVYSLNTSNGNIKYNWGYNFNHTLSPFYINYHNKVNLVKITKIIDLFLEEFRTDEDFYFITLTMPNLPANVEFEEKNKALIKKANQTITDIYKRLEKEYAVTGMVKKYETTYKYRKGKSEANHHFHVIVAIDKNVRAMKGDGSKPSMREFVLRYWFKNFLVKNFEAYQTADEVEEERMYNVAKGSFDIQKADATTINKELAGYISKNNKYDYLLSQEIFDYAYVHMHQKRILTYSGLFKKANQQLKLDDINDLEELENDESEYDTVLTFYYSNKSAKYTFSNILIRDLRRKEEEPTAGLDNSTSSRKKEVLENEEFLRNEFTEKWTESDYSNLVLENKKSKAEKTAIQKQQEFDDMMPDWMKPKDIEEANEEELKELARLKQELLDL